MVQFLKYVLFVGIGIAVASTFFVVFVPKIGTTNNPPAVDSGDDSVQGTPTPSDNCQITSCHGLDITCGMQGPQMCTMEYRLGDFCREFASCQTVQGECQFVETEQFKSCKSCVESCTQEDPLDAFACEDLCRKVSME